MSVDAVIFDMDGLMFDTERMARVAWERAMAEWGHVMPQDVYLTALGRTAPQVQSLFAQALGAHLPWEAIYHRKEQYLEDALIQHGVPCKLGLVELLAQLEQWRIPKAVASSTARAAVLRKLALAGLMHRFQVIVGGDEVAQGKPAPDIFLAAARQLRVEAAMCVVLEDADAGIQAASAAGMTPVMVPDMKTPAAAIRALTHRIVPSLRDVPGVIATLRGVVPKR